MKKTSSEIQGSSIDKTMAGLERMYNAVKDIPIRDDMSEKEKKLLDKVAQMPKQHKKMRELMEQIEEQYGEW